MQTICIVYSMFANRDEALSVARTLLDERLIACANLLGGIESLYRWEGTLQQENELMLLVKTSAAQRETVIARIKSLHPYELPCIVSMHADGGFIPFLQWVNNGSA